MTGLHLFKHRSQHRASDGRPRRLPTRGWRKAEPPDLRPGSILIGLGIVLGLGYILRSIFTQPGDVAFVLLFASALLLLGSALLLVAIGQHLASKLSGIKKHCGACRFFEVPSGLYVIGRCQADPSRHLVSRSDSCPSFFFSERALVRDRLGHQPGVLKQLRIMHTSDATNQS